MKKLPGATEEENRLLDKEDDLNPLVIFYGVVILIYGIFSVITVWIAK